MYIGSEIIYMRQLIKIQFVNKGIKFINSPSIIKVESVTCIYFIPTYFDNKESPIINEPVPEISNNVVCAASKASDQPAHTRSLIRAFTSRLSIL